MEAVMRWSNEKYDYPATYLENPATCQVAVPFLIACAIFEKDAQATTHIHLPPPLRLPQRSHHTPHLPLLRHFHSVAVF